MRILRTRIFISDPIYQVSIHTTFDSYPIFFPLHILAWISSENSNVDNWISIHARVRHFIKRLCPSSSDIDVTSSCILDFSSSPFVNIECVLFFERLPFRKISGLCAVFFFRVCSHDQEDLFPRLDFSRALTFLRLSTFSKASLSIIVFLRDVLKKKTLFFSNLN